MPGSAASAANCAAISASSAAKSSSVSCRPFCSSAMILSFSSRPQFLQHATHGWHGALKVPIYARVDFPKASKLGNLQQQRDDQTKNRVNTKQHNRRNRGHNQHHRGKADAFLTGGPCHFGKLGAR